MGYIMVYPVYPINSDIITLWSNDFSQVSQKECLTLRWCLGPHSYLKLVHGLEFGVLLRLSCRGHLENEVVARWSNPFFSASEFKMWAGTKNASYVCLCVWVIHKLEWKIQWIGGNQVTIEKFTTQMHDSPICITQWSPMVCICWAPSGLACTAHWSCVLSNQRWSCFQFESQKDLVCCSNEKVVRQIQNLSTRFRFKSHQFFQLELDTERWKWILFLRMWGDLGPRDGELTMEEYQAHLHVMSSGLMIDPTEMCPLSTYGFCYSKFKCYMMLNVQSLWGLPCFNLGMFPPSAI